MTTQRRYSIEFKRQIVQEYRAGESLHGLAKRHGIGRNLVRIWAAKAEAGEFDDNLAAASILQEYEADRRACCRLRQRAHRFAHALDHRSVVSSRHRAGRAEMSGPRCAVEGHLDTKGGTNNTQNHCFSLVCEHPFPSLRGTHIRSRSADHGR
jgi:transposase-like protein